MIKCLGKDRNGDICRNFQLLESKFCKFHQYMNVYTPEMLLTLEMCGGCKKMYYFEGKIKTCEICRVRGKKNRRNNIDNIILCYKEGCKFKKSKENKYCGKHQLCVFEDETNTMNKKVCYNYIRGCRSQLELDYEYSKCVTCLEFDRENDKIKRGNIIEKNNTLISLNSSNKNCTSCCKELSLDNFIGELSSMTKTCINCRKDNKKQDLKRDKQHRNSTVRYNIHPQYRTYVKNARKRNLEFNISFENYESIVTKPCYYCKIIQQRGFNGMDRKESSIGYALDNCISCCQMCNYIKGSLSVSVFIKRIEHILVYQKIIAGKLYPECFPNHKKCSYIQYCKRAEKNGIDITMSFSDYNVITENPCYICGKINDNCNENGIDRVDNSKGYILENVRACCAECNYMKIDYCIYDLFEKFSLIYENSKNIILELQETNVRISRFKK